MMNDINAFHELNNLGVILDLRVVASDPSINIIDKINEQLIAKLNNSAPLCCYICFNRQG